MEGGIACGDVIYLEGEQRGVEMHDICCCCLSSVFDNIVLKWGLKYSPSDLFVSCMGGSFVYFVKRVLRAWFNYWHRLAWHVILSCIAVASG